ncbi:hypothetical protein ACEYW6_06860 [Nostoc sp. UIC 10607]
MALIQEYDLLGTRVLHLIGTANDKHLSAQCLISCICDRKLT